MIKQHSMSGLALVAVFAFSAIIATTAFGAEFLLAEWAVGGVKVTAATATKTEGIFLFEDEKVPIAGKVAFECEGVLVGTVGANGADEITKVLNLAEVEITLGGTELSCAKQTGCEEAAKVAPLSLPWKTLLQLEEPGGLFRDLIEGTEETTAGYEVTCKVFGISSTDTCREAPASGSKVSNGATDVLLTAETVTPNGNCSLGGKGSSKIQIIEGLVSTTSGILSVVE